MSFIWDDDFMSQRIDTVKYDIHRLFIDKNIIDIFYVALIMNEIFEKPM